MNILKNSGFTLIENQEKLSKIITRLEKGSVIGVDLEADSMFHYPEKVCLIQFSTPSENIIIDPLSINDLSELFHIFSDNRIRKVFHGSDYDIRSLYRDFRFDVNSLFDTQIAARFLGAKEISLAALLKDRFHVNIEKKYQKRDWAKRPISKNMLAYAALDTFYLLPLSRILEKELISKDLLFCVTEECEILSKVRPPKPDNSPLFTRFKGAGKLGPRTLAVLESLLRLREGLALRYDRPPFKIMGNDQILLLARKKPVSLKELEKLKGLRYRQVKRFGKPVLKCIEVAMALPKSKLPVYPKNARSPVPPQLKERIKKLRAWRDKKASAQGIETAQIFTNTQIKSIACAFPHRPNMLSGIDGIRKWQIKLFGKDICAVLNED